MGLGGGGGGVVWSGPDPGGALVCEQYSEGLMSKHEQLVTPTIDPRPRCPWPPRDEATRRKGQHTPPLVPLTSTRPHVRALPHGWSLKNDRDRLVTKPK